MRDREKAFAARGAQLLTVIAHDALFVQHLPGAKMPESSPFPLLVDPTATVSATYGAAFQKNARGFWTNRQVTFVIDREGVIRGRKVGNSPRLSCTVQRGPLLGMVKRLPAARRSGR